VGLFLQPQSPHGAFELKGKAKIRELLWLEPVSMTIKKGGIRWLGRAKCVDDDADWVKYCTTVETDRTRQVSEKDLVEQ